MTIHRILIAGGPGTGKSTLAACLSQQLHYPIHSTDDTISTLEEWHLRVIEVAENWMQQPAPWIIEGVLIPVALRYLRDSGAAAPADLLIYQRQPYKQLTLDQQRMAKGVQSVYAEIRGYVPEPRFTPVICKRCRELVADRPCPRCGETDQLQDPRAFTS